jgi:hypothetical protein
MHCFSTAKWLQECVTVVEHMVTALFFSMRCFSFYLSVISQTNPSSVSTSLISFYIIPCFCMASFLSCHSHINLPFSILDLFLHLKPTLGSHLFYTFFKTCPYHCILFLVHLCSNAFIFKFALIVPSYLSVLCLFLLYFCWS